MFARRSVNGIEENAERLSSVLKLSASQDSNSNQIESLVVVLAPTTILFSNMSPIPIPINRILGSLAIPDAHDCLVVIGHVCV
jgi:hypothetical protein